LESFKLGEVEGHWSRAGDHDLLSFPVVKTRQPAPASRPEVDVEFRTGTGAPRTETTCGRSRPPLMRDVLTLVIQGGITRKLP